MVPQAGEAAGQTLSISDRYFTSISFNVKVIFCAIALDRALLRRLAWCRVLGSLRVLSPALPASSCEPAIVLPKLAQLTGQAPGVVALRRGKLVGFLSAFLLPNFRGQRGAYSPEWANAAILEDANAIYQELYRAISAHWVRNGYLLHGLTLFANDRNGLAAWQWQGFGMIVADAIRDLGPVAGSIGLSKIRKATVADLEDLGRLHLGLRRHLASPPIFLPLDENWSRERYRQWLAEAGTVTWLAEVDGRAYALMRAEVGNEGAGELVRDEATVAITSAYTKPAQRNAGLATALLQTVCDWAVDTGAARVSVDFETQNISGARFWLRHFQPVAFSVLRQVDERILWAHADRAEAEFS